MHAAAEALAGRRVDVSIDTAASQLAVLVARFGIAVFDGLRGEQSLLRLASELGQVVRHRHSSTSGVTVLTNRVRSPAGPGLAGFTDQALVPHTDGSDQAHPPHLLVMACIQPATQAGGCVLVDGQPVHADLAASRPGGLTDLTVPRSAYFGGAAGFVGSVFELQPDGQISIRLRLDELVQFSPRTRRWLPLLREAIGRHAITFPLQAGSGYVLNNRRWLHGRQAFTGPRVMLRAHVTPQPTWQIPRGFIPSNPMNTPG